MDFVFGLNEKNYFKQATHKEKQNALVHSFLSRDWNSFSWMLQNGISLNDITYEILWDAVLRNDASAVEKLIAAGVDVNRVDGIAFREAIRLGNIEIAELLFNAGADPKVVNNQAMSIAAEGGNVQAISKLCSWGVPASGWNNDPICRAAENGHIAAVECLLKNGASLEDEDGNPLTLPIRSAIKNNNQELGKLIISALDREKIIKVLKVLEETDGYLPDDWSQRVEYWRLMLSMGS